jgi:hypothetical protein
MSFSPTGSQWTWLDVGSSKFLTSSNGFRSRASQAIARHGPPKFPLSQRPPSQPHKHLVMLHASIRNCFTHSCSSAPPVAQDSFSFSHALTRWEILVTAATNGSLTSKKVFSAPSAYLLPSANFQQQLQLSPSWCTPKTARAHRAGQR